MITIQSYLSEYVFVPTDRHKSVCNRCVIERFLVYLCCLDLHCASFGGFCHMIAKNLSPDNKDMYVVSCVFLESHLSFQLIPSGRHAILCY